eukprot:Gb_18002 [translate_table: standard]
MLSTWNSDNTHPCNCSGITCIPRTYRISILSISNNNITGNLITKLKNLKDLAYLELSSNLLAGNIPCELGRLGRFLKSLQTLDLSFNADIDEGMPCELGELTQLNTLSLSHYNLNGTMLPKIG